MLHIIGVAHRAQARKPDAQKTEAQDTFEDCLRTAIDKLKPAFVGEEDSEEALAKRGEVSISKEIAVEKQIEHRFCDPTQQERSDIGYMDCWSIEIHLSMTETLSAQERQLKAQAIEIARYFPIREQFWLQQLQGGRDTDAIFVCGDGHVEGFCKILDGNSVSYSIVERGIGTNESDEVFTMALKYLEKHPELANLGSDFWIAPRHRASQWRALQLDSDDEAEWLKAIDIVEDRIRGRFVRWIDSMVVERFSGFAVVALDCLLIETLIGFMTGEPSKGPDALLTKKVGNDELKFTNEQAQQFRESVRNPVIHDAETRSGWIIRPGKPDGQILTTDGGNVALNRNAFHAAVSRELEAWLTKLRSGDKMLRKNMRRRMEQIIKIHWEAV